ncbi:MAG: virulence RhuM family protein [Deferribacteres bacterium]|nr:virulence RhuM family protein [candidate division KSB1 bacterium]MCB9502344.1 virulence RhuM family protein [Deferribacteres bacterium]
MKNSEIILYTTPQGNVKVEVLVREETVWLTINKMAELFGATKQNISYHLQNIFKENELGKKATVKEILTVQTEGERQVSRNLEYYNLDAIISVGYRVNTSRATQFRIWATRVLREFITKGFALDDERLKQGGTLFGKDYFDELLERIREIRASERRFYQKITDIYAQCSIDYDPQSTVTELFYKTVQNKLHWAITGNTAAEIIAQRADSAKDHMGLTTWKNAPKGKVLKSDVTVAKNYLNEKEIRNLNRIVTMYLDFAELQAERQIPIKMQEWAERLDAFLQFNQYDVLNNPGQVSAAVAKETAEKEYEKFRIIQDEKFISDFDKEVKKLKKKDKGKGQ